MDGTGGREAMTEPVDRHPPTWKPTISLALAEDYDSASNEDWLLIFITA